ncbi:unnamed protein product [Ixodes pacificus]
MAFQSTSSVAPPVTTSPPTITTTVTSAAVPITSCLPISGYPNLPEVAAATLKLPDFWMTDSELWFLHIEATFRRKRITSQSTMFDYVVAALPQAATALVRDILRTPSADLSYDRLKTELIRRTTASEQQRLQQLLTSAELGDRKPSELLLRMRQLLGDKAENLDRSIFRELFLQRLPQDVRMVLTTADSCSLESLARMADKMMEVRSPGISAVYPNSSQTRPQLRPQSEDDRISQLCLKVDQLADELASLRSAQQQTLRGRSPQRGFTRFSRPRSSSAPRTCWYHAKFGMQAQKCHPPCSFAENESVTRPRRQAW